MLETLATASISRLSRAVIAILIAVCGFAVAQEGADLLYRDGFEDCDNFNPPIDALFWDGGGDETTWSDPLNWVGDVVPADDDLVAIGGETTVTVVYDNSAGTTRLAHLDSCQNLQITGGSLEVDGPGFARGTLELSGSGTLTVSDTFLVRLMFRQLGNTTFDGAGTLTVTVAGSFLWSDGNQFGSGETIVNGPTTIDNTTKRLDSRTLTFNGATTWTGGNIILRNGGVINNNAPFDIHTDADMTHSIGAATTFNNNSTLTKSMVGDLTIIGANFANPGTISVTMGDLHMGHPLETNMSTGNFQISMGSFFGINGSHTMTGASSFTGAGGVRKFGSGSTSIEGTYTATGPLDGQGGTLSFAIPVTIEDDVTVSGGTVEFTQASSINANVMLSASGILEFNADVPVSGNLDHIGNSTMDGTGLVTVGGNFLWSDGNQNGSGETRITGATTIDNTTKRLDSRTLTFNGATTWTGGNIILRNGGVINNNAPFDIHTDADMTHSIGAATTFNNNSTLTKSMVGDLTIIGADFANSDTISVTMGDLHMGHPLETNMSTGNFQISMGSFFGINGSHTMTGGFTGAGGVRKFGSGSTSIEGTYTATGPLDGQGGTLSFAIPVTIEDDVTVSGGTVEFTQASSINANVMLSASGILEFNADVPVSGNLDHIGNSTMDGTGLVTVGGNFLWSDGNQNGSGETRITGTTTIDNTTKRLDSRTLTFNGATTWTGGNIILRNGGVINNNAPFDIHTDADMLHSIGAVTTFNNNSTLTKEMVGDLTSLGVEFMNFGSVAVSTGELAFGRTFTQDATGSINVNISSISDFDTFAVTQGVMLDGTLDITLIGGYQPVDMDSFTIMTFTTDNATTFMTVNGISIGNGNEFNVLYPGNNVTLDVVPE